MLLLGRSDRVDLPGLGLENIHAKIDTGAYTCSLHCSRAEIVGKELEFILLDEEHPEFTGMPFRVKKFEQREIKNSFGEAELRFVIRTKVKIAGKVIRAEFSLSNRGNLKFPVLLGRKILRHRFLIDVTKKDLSFNQKINPPSQAFPTTDSL
ncbi:MAG: ATP-dependent zinc protease [Cyclobacteriaceae bacterium]|nr:ATP-dependent zinc protease [Cyclobacteriaceae bacterium]